jgi:membrane protein implicated in regulation of membrane protease activity
LQLSTIAWAIAAVGIGVVSALARDRWTAPWAAGAVAAGVLDALGAGPAWPWAGFLLVSAVVFLIVNFRRYVPRHSRGVTRE